MKTSQKNALLSVFNKEGIVDFGRSLVELGWHLFASGGTAKALATAGIPVVDVATLVGEPILGHRVVTLSREIHAGLLARDTEEDMAELEKLGIPWFELVCVDLYPLEREVADLNATVESVIEKTDIGGPTMLRSAAKGRRLVIAEFEDRAAVIARLEDGTADDVHFRHRLAMSAEGYIARYCEASSNYLRSYLERERPSELEQSPPKP
jgi:phosphoribosylaminoimidazolecarboxamide formyltransferase/IMP cyclohydrolase